MLHKPEHMWQQIHWRLMPQTPEASSRYATLDDAGSSTPNLDAQVILAQQAGGASWFRAL